MKEYFHHQNYIAIYLQNFFDVLGKSVISTFSAVFLFHMGVPVHFILLFFAIQFGVMGILSPLCPVLLGRIGIVWTICIADAFRIVATILLLSFHDFSAWIFIVSLFFSLDGAIYHPLNDSVVATYVENSHKGKINSLNTLLSAIAAIIAIGIASYSVASGNNSIIIGASVLSLIISALSFRFLLEKRDMHERTSFFGVYRFLFSSEFRENLVPFGLQTFLIIERIFIPLFVFTIVGSFQVTFAIVVLGTLIELLVTFFFGRKIDAFARKAFFASTSLKSLASVFFLLPQFSLPWLYFCQSYAKTTENLFDNSFGTLLQTKARKNNPLLFTTAKEMILCFTEGIVLPILALLSFFIGTNIFPVIFGASFVAIFVIYRLWKH